jgi:hypothetical protein
MTRPFLLHLTAIERHLRDCERHLLRQREIVAELERHGHGSSQTATIAKDILASFEMVQTVKLNQRVHLLQTLTERT